MHGTSQGPAAKDRNETAEKTKQVNGQAGEQGQEEKQRPPSVQEAGVGTVTEKFALVDIVGTDAVEEAASFIVEAVNRGSHATSPSWVVVQAEICADPPLHSAGRHLAGRIGPKFPAPV